MTAALYMDHNVVRAVVEGCRVMGLDVLTAFEDGWHKHSDIDILERATTLGRAVFTQDTDFIVLAAQWQNLGKHFPGVVFGKHANMTSFRSVTSGPAPVQVQLKTQPQWIPASIRVNSRPFVV